MADQRVRFTVRIDETLRAQVKAMAAERHETVEELTQRALKRELAETGAPAEALVEWGPDLAKRFLDCLPTPVALKDGRNATIVWCNLAYEDIVGSRRSQLLGQRIDDTSLLDRTTAAHLKRDTNKVLHKKHRHVAMAFWEPMVFHARGHVPTIMRAYRFVFDGNNSRFLGDISFEWAQTLLTTAHARPEGYRERLRQSVANDAIKTLIASFLESCPVAIAIKNRRAELVWCNKVYEDLSGRRLRDMKGLTAQQIFGLRDEHPLVQNEHTVLQSDVWMYATEALPGKDPRTSLRFRICDAAGNVGFMGTVSAEFQLEDMRRQRNVKRVARAL